MSKKKIKPDPWIQGYACACAIQAKLGWKSEAQELAFEGGFDKESFVLAGVEPGDIEAIWPKESK